VTYVEPEYPAEAALAGLEGSVLIDAVVATDGSVRQARVVQGARQFVEAAVTAVRQWRYEPVRLNGQPVEVQIRVTVAFTR
jgi:TonB family protein